MKVAIVHYWLVGMRGGEKVLESLCRMYPDADIFTHAYVEENVSAIVRAHKIQTTFIGSLPRARALYKVYLPLMPLALEQLDLSEYDLVISSESGPAKGVIPRPGALHVCYCHTPMRYVWNMYHEYKRRSGFLTKLSMPLFSHYLRLWDVTSASRVDHFVANSETVKARIERYYRRAATVIHPPVACGDFEVVSEHELGDFYLMVGELVRYKRPELAVRAFNELGKRLVVIGGGEMLAELRRIARPNVTVLGSQPFEVLRHHLSRCQGLIFPGEEDFGMVPVEAMASGRPVLAFGVGGATETVLDGLTGRFFPEQTVASVIAGVEQMERTTFHSHLIAKHAEEFSVVQFEARMKQLIDQLLADRASRPSRRFDLADTMTHDVETSSDAILLR
ncbi:glycosyltransferase [Micromonospora sp. STR1s_5]|nr:glycosyltransferase [Micromonospora sp. STR1s_5]